MLSNFNLIICFFNQIAMFCIWNGWTPIELPAFTQTVSEWHKSTNSFVRQTFWQTLTHTAASITIATNERSVWTVSKVTSSDRWSLISCARREQLVTFYFGSYLSEFSVLRALFLFLLAFWALSDWLSTKKTTPRSDSGSTRSARGHPDRHFWNHPNPLHQTRSSTSLNPSRRSKMSLSHLSAALPFIASVLLELPAHSLAYQIQQQVASARQQDRWLAWQLAQR